MRTHLLSAALGIATAITASGSLAAPITYTGTLTRSPQVDSIPTTGVASSASSDLSDYWQFSGVAGQIVTITVRRLEGAFDPSFWLFQGLFSDDSIFGSSIGFGQPGLVDQRDDDLPPFLPGPHGDPSVKLALPSTGDYTVIVTNFDSDSDDGDGIFPYKISLAPVPLPASLPLLAGGLGLIGWIARRKPRV